MTISTIIQFAILLAEFSISGVDLLEMTLKGGTVTYNAILD